MSKNQKPQPQPRTITVNDVTPVAFAQAAALIRQGYIFAPNDAPDVHAYTGYSSIRLVFAEPDASTIKGAAEVLAHAVRLEVMAAERVAVAAKQAAEGVIAADRKLEQERLMAEAVAATERQLAALRESFTA